MHVTVADSIASAETTPSEGMFRLYITDIATRFLLVMHYSIKTIQEWKVSMFTHVYIYVQYIDMIVRYL